MGVSLVLSFIKSEILFFIKGANNVLFKYLGYSALCCLVLVSGLSYAKDWVYTVKPGDTLWDLCLNYTTHKNCWLEVGAYNGVGYPPSLAPGTRIRFPVPWLKAQPAPAAITFVAGNVQVIQPSGEKKQALVNDVLAMGSAVVVAEQATATLQFADGATLILESNSHIEMNLLTQHQHTGMVNTQLNLLSGAAKSRVPKRQPRSNFSVSTPSAIAAVRGTDFRISASEGIMRGEVFEGLVNIAKEKNTVSANKKTSALTYNSIDLAKNYGVFVKKGEPLTKPIKLLGPVAGLTNETHVSLPYTLTWQPLAKAVNYKIELLAQNKTEEVFVSHYQKETQWRLPIDQNQCFTVRISAIDQFDLQGMPATRDMCASQPLSAVQKLTLNKRLLNWQPLVGAKSYRIEASANESFESPEVIAQTTQTFYELNREFEGRYLRVVVVDQQDLTGSASDVVEFKASNTQGIIATVLFMLLLAL